jgi:hypothetical protein
VVDLLGQLAEYVDRAHGVPLVWVIEHARECDLRALWNDCSDATTLVIISASVAGWKSLVPISLDLMHAAAPDVQPRLQGAAQALIADLQAWHAGDAAAVHRMKSLIMCGGVRSREVDSERAAMERGKRNRAEWAWTATENACAPILCHSVGPGRPVGVFMTVSVENVAKLRRESEERAVADFTAMLRQRLRCPTLDEVIEASRAPH